MRESVDFFPLTSMIPSKPERGNQIFATEVKSTFKVVYHSEDQGRHAFSRVEFRQTVLTSLLILASRDVCTARQ
jgi:hypothetical protein